ncbi:hypothetical protein [Tateyamaria sp.]
MSLHHSGFDDRHNGWVRGQAKRAKDSRLRASALAASRRFGEFT